MNKSRRPLTFASLAEIPPDLDQLRAGHRTVGRWSLAQICNHLTYTIDSSLDGFPLRTAPWPVRVTFGKLAIHNMLRTGRIPEGFPLPKKVQPLPDLDLETEAARLRASVDRFLHHTGPLAPHPFIGLMSHDRYHAYHRVHCAHHLSFAVPTAVSSPIDTTTAP